MLLLGDFYEHMMELPENSVNAILTDPPYGTTKNKWDNAFDVEKWWQACKRVLVKDGAVVFTAAQPFSSQMVISNPKWFKYEWVWSKTIGSGQLNIHHRPLNSHEVVLVFSPSVAKYNPQMTAGDPYKISRKTKDWEGRGYNSQKDHTKENTGERYPKSVLHISNPRIKGGHPTQKPLELFEYLVQTYTDDGDVVLDPFMGSGTTGVACANLNRKFIGIELDPQYFNKTKERIDKALSDRV